jgi:hypothetical protein
MDLFRYESSEVNPARLYFSEHSPEHETTPGTYKIVYFAYKPEMIK